MMNDSTLRRHASHHTHGIEQWNGIEERSSMVIIVVLLLISLHPRLLVAFINLLLMFLESLHRVSVNLIVQWRKDDPVMFTCMGCRSEVPAGRRGEVRCSFGGFLCDEPRQSLANGISGKWASTISVVDSEAALPRSAGNVKSVRQAESVNLIIATPKD
jgi:hypothetical protein